RGVLDGERGELRNGEPGHAHGQGLRAQAGAGANGAARLAAVAGEEDADVELVAIRLHLLEEALDAGELSLALVDELPLVRPERLPGPVHGDAAPARRLHQLALVPATGRVRPGLDGAVGETPRGIRHHEGLVVLEDVAEPLALGTGAERVVEREQERLRTLERHPAAGAAERFREAAYGAVDH